MTELLDLSISSLSNMSQIALDYVLMVAGENWEKKGK